MPHAVSDPADTKYCIAVSVSVVPSVSKFYMDRCFQCARKRKIPLGKTTFRSLNRRYWCYKLNVQTDAKHS